LPGTYRALLASSTASAASRFSTTGTTWVRPDGLPVFATASDLDTMTVVTPIVLSAGGGYMGNYALWSGAATPTTAGTLATCENWASNSADGGVPPATAGVTGFTQAPSSGASAWGYTTLPCSATYGTVYCLQQ
jgi:hypothetical protein